MEIKLFTSHPFVRFCFVGSIGFCTDLLVLLSLMALFDAGPIVARAFSFMVAMTVTWLLNRSITFRVRTVGNYSSEWLKYAAVNGTGGAINFSIYSLLILARTSPLDLPIIALSIATGIALIFNYLGSKHFVFVSDTE